MPRQTRPVSARACTVKVWIGAPEVVLREIGNSQSFLSLFDETILLDKFIPLFAIVSIETEHLPACEFLFSNGVLLPHFKA
jgi:hypothetical protein